MKLSLHLPGLLTPKAESESLHPITQLRLPALSRLLARARVRPAAVRLSGVRQATELSRHCS